MNKASPIRDVTQLPDYQSLQKLAGALWQEDNAFHGAAVMIGAGFSRCAALTGDANRKLPLWYDFSLTLAKDLKGNSISDPLRLAEEYAAFFGKQALHDLIKKEINDAAWFPGELHHSLLKLPWSEILTTNWDTLLERASKEVHSPVYNIVTKSYDLSSARTPRIVKLHGTVNVTDELIFTQEDYRKYPQQNAAFVNFARQVFIENELCLIGFSGDDPNFLQWAGWVRDQLTTRARRIYLVGALNLTAPKRKYLESINVAPIDLSDIVSEYDDLDTKHIEATKIFLEELDNLKPKPAWEWSPSKLEKSATTSEELDNRRVPAYAATILEQQLPTIETDRKTYPGWLICPTATRFDLQNQIHSPYPSASSLAEMSSDKRAKLLYEIAWQHNITFEVIPLWLAEELLKICDLSSSIALTRKQQLEVALLLLKNTRWLKGSEDKYSIERTTTAILEKEAKYWPESTDELLFHQSLVARDQFDYPLLGNLVEKLTEKDPVWMLKKASLLAELGRTDKGEILIEKAYQELLGQYRNDRNSIYVYSRLAWAHWLVRGIGVGKPGKRFEPFPSHYQDLKCSPWNHIEHIQERISKSLDAQNQLEIEPLFEPGHYKDNSNSVTISSELPPLVLMDGITNTVGMPLRWDMVSFLVGPASRLAGLHDIDTHHQFSLAIRAASSDSSEVLNKVFSRTQTAQLSPNDANYLLENCLQAVNYWTRILSEGKTPQQNSAMGRLQVFIEVLARVCVRAKPEQAKDIFRLAVNLGKNNKYHHIWLFKPLKHLINYSLQSVPESQHHELIIDALSFPLESEIGNKFHQQWPNPVIELPGKRVKNTIIDRRIDEIIDLIVPNSSTSAPALIRLLPLLKSKFLKDDECIKIASKMWQTSMDYDEIPGTGLLPHVLLELPSANPTAVDDLVRKHLFEAKDEALFNSDLLISLSSAAETENIKAYPNKDQSINYFDRLSAWRAKDSDTDPFGWSKQEANKKGKLIGKALALAIVPALPKTALTKDNFDKLHKFYSEVESPEIIIAFVYFARETPDFIEHVEKLIRQGLQSHDSDKVSFSSFALFKWKTLGDVPTAIERLISRLIYLVGSHRMIALPALLWTTNQMLNSHYLSTQEVESLMETIPIIFDNTSYGNIFPASKEAINASLIRTACVKLARDILKQGNTDEELQRVLEEARLDPLPEVRFAETANQ